MKRLRVLMHPWHTAHDYELCKLPHDIFMLRSTARQWAVEQRPVPAHVRWVDSASEADADVMILHVDQWAYREPSKRFLMEIYKADFAGPKAVINHGCNLVDGCSSAQMRELVDGCYTVCNSPTAHTLWAIPRSRYIRHGMSAEEWRQTNYAHTGVTIIQAHGRTHGAYRNNAAVEKLERRTPVTWIGRDKRFENFDQYRHFLSSSSILFNPSYASPNPRSRTEAMLCGLAIVTTNTHGESGYIVNGQNGYASNDMDELIEYAGELAAKPALARELGRAGRETAQKIFSIGQFVDQWNALLAELTSPVPAAVGG